MFTIDVLGGQLIEPPVTASAIRDLGSSVAGHCRNSLFVALICNEEHLRGCSVIAGYTRDDEAAIRTHLEQLTKKLGTATGMVLDPADPCGSLPMWMNDLIARLSSGSGFRALIESRGPSTELRTREDSS